MDFTSMLLEKNIESDWKLQWKIKGANGIICTLNNITYPDTYFLF